MNKDEAFRKWVEEVCKAVASGPPVTLVAASIEDACIYKFERVYQSNEPLDLNNLPPGRWFKVEFPS